MQQTVHAIQDRQAVVGAPQYIQRVAEIGGQGALVLRLVGDRIGGNLVRGELERLAVVRPERQVEVVGELGERQTNCG
ncbi:hypothetical protein EV650_4187 [Kribbella kalugense]|uniref:Uncharacterized protein n=1 Tax=Kribbella kalugense TaxID=2512221 RepID=A0A4R7ZJL7_9ACTN|nr:hypothetical protein EV650_4187 [Kribbella kalugense]